MGGFAGRVKENQSYCGKDSDGAQAKISISLLMLLRAPQINGIGVGGTNGHH
ncbi:MAG: hypothetical protein JO266_01230 [Acidobacteria bacterium]|nr:hypothetical protein [Acidobacteriota bacterium]